MLSSFFPWEYFKNPSQLAHEQGTIAVLYSYDPFIERMILSEGLRREKNQYDRIFLPETNCEWFETHFFSQDLFSQQKAFLFFHSNEANKKMADFILSILEKIRGKNTIFVFYKEDHFFKTLCSSKYVRGFKIKEPPFWQREKLFDFLCAKMRVRLHPQIREYLLDSVKDETHEIINALKTIMLNCPVGAFPTMDSVKKLIRPKRLDFFKLANLYAEKNFTLFYRELLGMNYSGYRGVFNFLQNHLIKIYDHNYGKGKVHLSSYDKNIKTQQKKWTGRNETANHIQKMAEMEILAKRKDPLLKARTRLYYLEGLKKGNSPIKVGHSS